MSEYFQAQLDDARDRVKQRIEELDGEIAKLSVVTFREVAGGRGLSAFSGAARRTLTDRLLEQIGWEAVLDSYDLACEQVQCEHEERVRKMEADRPAREEAARIDALLHNLLALAERLGKAVFRADFDRTYDRPPDGETARIMLAAAKEWNAIDIRDFHAAYVRAGKNARKLDELKGHIQSALEHLKAAADRAA